MLAIITLASLTLLSTLVLAQDDLASFPCDRQTCAQQGQPDMECVQASNGNRYCGWSGALCTSTAQCDAGYCSSGRCIGQPGDSCPGGFPYRTYNNRRSDGCLGGTACSSTTSGRSGTCGGTSSGCSSDVVCSLGYCDRTTSQCAPRPASGRPRERRTLRFDNRCARGLTACELERGVKKSFECVDLQVSLERCGACFNDCSEMEGVDEVNCVHGTCLISSCDRGFALSADPLAAFFLLALGSALAKVPDRDCFTGEPPFCNNSLAQDPTCRGLTVTSTDGWERMDCDYVLFDVPATKRKTKKWIVIHSGACDDFTKELGDYFAPAMQLNLFGLRPCGGFEDSLCANRHDYDVCTALHISWYMMPKMPTFAPYGYGFNPPALIDIYHIPGSNMVFLHEYGTKNTSYSWYSADGCNAYTKPLYMCLAGIDPDYTAKFRAIKALLEPAFANSTLFPCNLEVIDTMPYAQEQDAEIPCTGILREYNDPAKVGADVSEGTAHNWAWEQPGFMTRAVEIATRRDPKGVLVQAYKSALNIALCKTFNANQTKCEDDDMTWS